MLKMGSETLEVALLILLNKCMDEDRIPSIWRNAEMIILYKKGDCRDIGKYRPISLPSVFYKLLMKIVMECLIVSKKFDF